MRRVYSLTIVFVFLLVAASGFSQQVYFDGEGYVTPTEKSRIPFNPDLAAPKHSSRQQGNIVTVTPLSGDFPHVVLLTTVQDSNGNPISGLTRDDFAIAEQSTSEDSPTGETITCFREFQAGERMGITFSLVFDVSDSMTSGTRLAEAKAAAVSFLENCGENDRGSFVTFSTGGFERIELAADWVATDADSNGSYDIVDAVNDARSPIFALTAVYDGIAAGIESLGQEAAPKAVIVFTDGETNSDVSYDINEIVSRANNEGVIVYTIGLGVDPQNLRDIADSTGGIYSYAPTAADMTTVYEDIYDEIVRTSQSQYAICYTTHNPSHDGTTRTVSATYSGSTGNGIYVVNSRPEIERDAATIGLSAVNQSPGSGLTISGTITDEDAESLGQTLAAELYHRTAGQSEYSRVPLVLSNRGGGDYAFSGVIPDSDVQEPAVEYYILAGDGVQTTYSPFNYTSLPYSITVGSNNPPTIAHTPVASAQAGTAVPISAQITDPDDGDGVNRAVIYYRPHNPYQTTFYLSSTMSDAGGGNYAADIPASQVTSAGVDYFISAWDNNGARSDNGGADNPYFIQVGANSYTRPIADAGPDATLPEESTAALDGTGSTDPDGNLSYEWLQTDGPSVTLSNANTAQPTFTTPSVDSEGDNLAFQLTVWDESCLYSTDTVTVAVSDAAVAEPPSADFTWTPESPGPEQTVNFTDGTTFPGTAENATWAWDFGGTGSSSEQNPSHAFEQSGSYPVTLTVTNSQGASDSVTHTITVRECEGNCEADGGCFVSSSGNGANTLPIAAVVMLFAALIPLVFKFGGIRRMKKLLPFLILVLVAGLPMNSFSENKAKAVTISPMVGYYMYDDDQEIDSDFILGLGLGYNFTENVSAEVMGTYGQFVHHYHDPATCSCAEQDLDGYKLHLDCLYHFMPDRKLVPYLAIGAGGVVQDYEKKDRESSFMANAGGGMKYFFSENVAFRADARYIQAFDDSNSNAAATVGLTFQLPSKKRMADEKPPEPTPTPEPKVKPEKKAEKGYQPESPTAGPAKQPTKKTGKKPKYVPVPVPKPTPKPPVKKIREEWIRLRIQFDFDKAIVKSKYHNEIMRVANLLKKYPDVDVVIEGHTCSIGSEGYNQKLSQRRADSVKRYLVNKFNVPAARLTTKGYGESRPEFDNSTKDGRRKNRRVLVVKMIEIEE